MTESLVKDIVVQRQRNDKDEVPRGIRTFYEVNLPTQVGMKKERCIQFLHHDILNTTGLYHSIVPWY